ncbi:hypothetical protein TRFO_08645 [Tritrichomonas foetus]|uniref:HEAT repeat family protein n=1 Tax=Tritrichomonas foetus TaxID=1144522 RepID=A0A1J4JKX8_9EUKA|nr:hypothetical protein TRFO_08645 [Tritrichomonas foetus]|eukprot:OHS99071.1 hypothetical protein TRFO_08645 [Tritrichomonas foetus]
MKKDYFKPTLNRMSLSASEIYQKILDLRTQDEISRVAAIQFIPTIASALGTTRTCDELLPYIVETAIFTEDQWIKVLDAIGKINYAELSEKQINNVFYTICSICEMESRAIREAFIKCFVSIVQKVKPEVVDNVLKQMIITMLEQKESPSIRAAAIAVYANTITKFSPQVKQSLFMKIEAMKEDPAVNVRQSYASSAALMAAHVKGALATNLLTSMSLLASDDSYSVCCEVPKFLISYMKAFNNAQKVFEIGEKLMASKNWRVRCMYVASLSDIFKGQTVEFGPIFNIIENASKDPDDEVQTAAAEELVFLSELQDIDKDKVRELLERLLKSNCSHVKTSTALALPDFVKVLPGDFVCSSLIQLTKDSSQEVKITAIQSLKSPKVPVDVKSKGLEEASNTNEWREKESIVKLLPELTLDTNNDFLEIVIKMLKDDANKVRRSIIDKLPFLVARKGSNLREEIVPALQEMADGDDYQLRQTAVSAIIKIEKFDKVGMDILEKASTDPVANVRLVVATSLPRSPQFKPLLNRLASDQDEDVRLEASQ